MYCYVYLGISTYFYIFLHISTYFYVFLRIITYIRPYRSNQLEYYCSNTDSDIGQNFIKNYIKYFIKYVLL